MDEALTEFKTMKRIIYKKYGKEKELQTKSWIDLQDIVGDFPNVMLLIDLLGCIPQTSVKCETTFSQLKLIKTARMTRLRSDTLNNLLLIKLEAPSIANFDVEPCMDIWMLKPRRPNYRRRKTVTVTQELSVDLTVDTVTTQDSEEPTTTGADTQTEVDTETDGESTGADTQTEIDTETDGDSNIAVDLLNLLAYSATNKDGFGDDDDDESENWDNVFLYRSS